MQQRPLRKSEDKTQGFGERGLELPATQAERWTSWSDGAELPVLTQPGLGVTTSTLTTITQTGGDWSTGLFDVCDDISTCKRNRGSGCLMGVFIPCCLDVSLAHQYGESLCLPLLPASTFAMRVAIRERFKIRGSVCDDWVTVFCCYPLAVSQMMREMKRRLKRQMYTVTTTLESC